MRDPLSTPPQALGRELPWVIVCALAAAFPLSALAGPLPVLALPIASALTGTWLFARMLGAPRVGAALAAGCFALALVPGGAASWDSALAHMPWGLLVLLWCAAEPRAGRLPLVLVTQALLFGVAGEAQRSILLLGVLGIVWGGWQRAPGAGPRLLAAGIGAAIGVAWGPQAVSAAPLVPRPFEPLGTGLLLCFAGGLGWIRALVRGGAFGPRAAVLGIAAGALWWGLALRAGFALDQALGLAPAQVAAASSFPPPTPSLILGLALIGILAGAPLALGLLALGAWALSSTFPGALEIWQRLPVLGAAGPPELAVAAALALGLLAAHALAEPRGRLLARGCAGLLAAGAAWALIAPTPNPPPREPLDVPDEVLSWEIHDAPFEAGATLVDGELAASLPAEGVRVVLLYAEGSQPRPREVALDLSTELATEAQDDRRAFHAAHTTASAALPAGSWMIVLSLERRGAAGELDSLALRRIGMLYVPRAACARRWRVALFVLALSALVSLPGRRRGWAFAVLLLAFAQGGLALWCSPN